MQKMSKIVFLISYGLVIKIFLPAFASTQTQNGNMTVSATVAATCTMTTNPLSFGSYHTANTSPTTSQSSLGITCTNGAPYYIQINGGTSSQVSARTMTMNSNTLPYGIYKDAGYSQNWGITNGTDVQTGTGTGSLQTIPIYGRINSGQNVPLGSYQDTVSITINY